MGKLQRSVKHISLRLQYLRKIIVADMGGSLRGGAHIETVFKIRDICTTSHPAKFARRLWGSDTSLWNDVPPSPALRKTLSYALQFL